MGTLKKNKRKLEDIRRNYFSKMLQKKITTNILNHENHLAIIFNTIKNEKQKEYILFMGGAEFMSTTKQVHYTQ